VAQGIHQFVCGTLLPTAWIWCGHDGWQSVTTFRAAGLIISAGLPELVARHQNAPSLHTLLAPTQPSTLLPETHSTAGATPPTTLSASQWGAAGHGHKRLSRVNNTWKPMSANRNRGSYQLHDKLMVTEDGSATYMIESSGGDEHNSSVGSQQTTLRLSLFWPSLHHLATAAHDTAPVGCPCYYRVDGTLKQSSSCASLTSPFESLSLTIAL